jgi:uncharacterized protein DUF4169
MGNVVNLNRFRKQKAKADRKKQADVNRRLHGRTTAERAHDALQKQQLTRSVDGAKLDRPTPAPPATGQTGPADTDDTHLTRDETE